jgi:hypothetical protein
LTGLVQIADIRPPGQDSLDYFCRINPNKNNMPLLSRLFKGDGALEACLTQDPAHLTQGASGNHVSKIHTALLALDGFSVDATELRAARYGPSTAAGVLAYKTRRNIVNRAYQQVPDNIVGKMTIASMDKEMVQKENERNQRPDQRREPAIT